MLHPVSATSALPVGVGCVAESAALEGLADTIVTASVLRFRPACCPKPHGRFISSFD